MEFHLERNMMYVECVEEMEIRVTTVAHSLHAIHVQEPCGVRGVLLPKLVIQHNCNLLYHVMPGQPTAYSPVVLILFAVDCCSSSESFHNGGCCCAFSCWHCIINHWPRNFCSAI